MRRRAWVGTGAGVAAGIATLILMPRASSPVDEAIRVLGLKNGPGDNAWLSYLYNGMSTGRMSRAFILTPAKNTSDVEMIKQISVALEPIGWIRSDLWLDGPAGLHRWEKSGCTLDLEDSPISPEVRWITLERPSSLWDGFRQRLAL
ncbi:MAG: hypothetical protein WCK51_07025 [Armatimonadota bacterium]